MLVAELPAGSGLALGSRTRPPLGIARLRARHRLVEVGQAELAFDVADAVELFHHAGLDVSAEDAGQLVERTEGWPAALYLSTLTAGDRTRGRADAALAQVGGDNRYVAEYLWEELLDRLDADTASFLLQASCLDRLSGPLCDEVLDRTGSAVLLEDLSSRNLLVIPLDDHREWYRLHHLMADVLRAELGRRDPAAAAAVHRRASAWFEAHDDIDAAITHAALGGDTARAEALVYDHYPPFLNLGRVETFERWLGLFTPDQLARAAAADDRRDAWPASSPATAPGRRRGWPGPTPSCPSGTRRRRRVGAAGGARRRHGDHRRHSPPRRWPTRPATPTNGSRRATGSRRRAWSAGRPSSCSGSTTRRAALLTEGIAEAADRPLIQALCLAHLAVVHIEQGRWDEATEARPPGPDGARRPAVAARRPASSPPSARWSSHDAAGPPTRSPTGA